MAVRLIEGTQVATEVKMKGHGFEIMESWQFGKRNWAPSPLLLSRASPMIPSQHRGIGALTVESGVEFGIENLGTGPATDVSIPSLTNLAHLETSEVKAAENKPASCGHSSMTFSLQHSRAPFPNGKFNRRLRICSFHSGNHISDCAHLKRSDHLCSHGPRRDVSSGVWQVLSGFQARRLLIAHHGDPR